MSDLLARLLSAGTPPELVAEVAMELARAEAAKEAIEQRRLNDRTRQAERRARNNVTSRDTADVTDAPLSLSPNENNSNPHTHTPENITPRARKTDFPKPDWADGQVWADFLTNRKAKRLQNTATAHAKFLNDTAKLSAETGWPPGECLRACVAKGWGAIFDPRDKHDGRSGQNFGSNSDRRDGVARALDRQLGLDGAPSNRRGTGGGGDSGSGPVAYLTAVR